MTTRPTRRTRPGRRSSGVLLLALLLGVLGPAVAAAPAAAQTAASRSAAAWSDLPASSASAAARRGTAPAVRPSRFRALGLDRGALAEVLKGAPRAAAGTAARSTGLTIALPAPDGRDRRFRVTRSAVLAPELAAAHPEIATYSGVGVDDEGATVRLDLTPLGFHASVRGPSGSWYVDPRFRRDEGVYASYRGEDLENVHGPFAEGEVEAVGRALRPEVAPRPGGSVVTARTYRLALLSDPSYAAYFGGADATDAEVAAAKATLVSRVNQIYEDDFAISLQLVAQTDDLNLGTAAEMTGANGPCGAQPCFTPEQAGECFADLPVLTIDRTRTVLGQLVGAGGYDVGHVVLGNTGGGVAYLGQVGDDLKGGGCTGVATPEGDLFAVDYVSHELGHQFGGDHTFNGTVGNCAANLTAAAVEPGSGSTIMGYAGICGSDDLQDHSDPYFSHKSIEQITEYADGAPVAVDEGQSVSLGSLNANDTFRLTFGGQTSPTITCGADASCAGGTYTPTSIKAAIQNIPGFTGTVTVTSLDDLSGSLNPAGFHVRFGGAAAGTNVSSLGITAATGGVTAVVGEATRGGGSGNGGTPVATPNRSPQVLAPPDATIPRQTPFALTGSATDADGNPLTYLWEQADPGTGAGLANGTKTRGPLFRVFGTAADVPPGGELLSPAPGLNVAGASPTRSFPDLAQIAAGTTNQATGACAGAGDARRDCLSEFLPTADYVAPAMRFRLTARDGAIGAGGVAHADTTLTLAAAGPFRVTGPGATTVAGGTAVPVTWEVAGTGPGTAVNAADVRIALSTDGGLTFPTELEASTPNDGSATVVVPNVETTKARLRVAAVGNVFFDVSHANLTITENALGATNDAPAAGASAQHTDALSPAVTISATDTAAAGSALSATATGLPGGLSLAVASTSPGGAPGMRFWTVAGAVDAAPGTYPVSVLVGDGTRTATTTFDVVVAPEDAAATYAGDTAVAGAPGAGEATATLRFAVDGARPGDATAGSVSAATVTVRRDGPTGPVLCAAVPVAPGASAGAGVATCSATLAAGAEHTVVGTVGGRYAGSATGEVRVTATPAAGSDTTPTTPAPPATPTTPTTPATPPTPLSPGPGLAPIVPAAARLQPVLTATARRLRVTRAGRVPVRIRCRASGTGTAAATCSGTLRITAKLGGRTRTVGTASFRIARTATKTVNVRVSTTARRLLRRDTKATVTATATNGSRGTLRTTRGVTLLPRR